MYSKSILKSIFIRNGGEGQFIHLVDSIGEPLHEKIRSKVELKEGEQPIVMGDDGVRWVLITTSKTVWNTDDDISCVNHSQLVNVTFDASAAIRAQIKTAAELENLSLPDSFGNQYVLKIECGKPFSGVWNLLRYIAMDKKG